MHAWGGTYTLVSLLPGAHPEKAYLGGYHGACMDGYRYRYPALRVYGNVCIVS